MIPPKTCPTPQRCELVGCERGACRAPEPKAAGAQAVAVTPPPIPLHLRHLSDAERGFGLVRFTERLQQLLRPRPAPAAASAPFLLPPLQESAMSDYLAPPHELSPPAKPAKPAAAPPAAPASTARRPTTPVQVIPVRSGGFVIIGDGGPIAVAVDGPGLAEVLQRWAGGDLA